MRRKSQLTVAHRAFCSDDHDRIQVVDRVAQIFGCFQFEAAELRNGEVVQTGAGAALLGHPANAVAWLANAVGRFGVALKAREIVMPAAISAAVDVSAGDVIRASFDGLGHFGGLHLRNSQCNHGAISEEFDRKLLRWMTGGDRQAQLERSSGSRRDRAAKLDHRPRQRGFDSVGNRYAKVLWEWAWPAGR